MTNNTTTKYSYLNLNNINTNNELSLLEQLAKLEVGEIAVDFKNKKLYHKTNIVPLDLERVSKDIEVKKNRGEKIDISTYLNGAYIVEYNILDTNEIDKTNIFDYYLNSDISNITEPVIEQKICSFILENPKTKEYIGMFPSGFFNKGNNNVRVEYNTVRSSISRLPFYFKNNELTIFTEDNKKLKLDKQYKVYYYQIDRVILGDTSFAILYTDNNNTKYVKVIYNNGESVTHNITNVVASKGKDIDIIQVQGAGYIHGIVPFLAVDVDDIGEEDNNVSVNGLQGNTLFVYILPEEVKAVENVVDFFVLNKAVYTVSMIQGQYYLYRNGVYLRNFQMYYGSKNINNEYVELYVKNYNTEDNKLDVFKIDKQGNIEFSREEEKTFNIYDLSGVKDTTCGNEVAF